MEELGFTDGVLDEPVSKVYTLWSRANVGEVFPDPITPLNATAGFLELLDRGWRDAMVETRTLSHDDLDPDARHITIACFQGYLFLNMSLFRLFGERLGVGAAMIDMQYFGEMPGIPSYASEARPTDADPEKTAAAQVWLAEEVLGAKDLSRFDEERRIVEAIVADRPDLATASDEAVLGRIIGFDDLFQRLWCSHIVASSDVGLGLGGCGQVVAAIGRPELALVLSGGIGDVDSAGAAKDMWPLSRTVRESAHLTDVLVHRGHLDDALRADTHPDAVAFVAAFDTFLARWGFRGPNEWELRSETWGTEPDTALAAIAAMSHAEDHASPEHGETARAAEREAATDEVHAAIAGDLAATAAFDGSLNAAHLFSRARERARMTAALLVHEQRLAARELGRRFASRRELDDWRLVFMLTRNELVGHVRDGVPLPGDLAERERRYLDLSDCIPPFVVIGSVEPVTTWPRHSTAPAQEPLAVGESLTGLSGSPGVVRGPARLVSDPRDPFAIEEGDVIVVPITDPAWTPLFLAAAGVVSDVGASVSHAAIVSRELGIPCVVSATGATERITDGMELEVDGTAGVVRRVS